MSTLRAGARIAGAAALALAAAGAPGPCRAQEADPYRWVVSETRVRAEVTPRAAKIGERVTYRARVVAPRGFRVAWGEPPRSPGLTWGSPATRTRNGSMPRRRQGAERTQPGTRGAILDTAWCEVSLQAFEPGRVLVPGLPFSLLHPADGMRTLREGRVPQVALDVVLTLSPADSNAQLHDLHGPLAAPWWERVPWRWAMFGLALVALALGLWWWLRRRGRAPAPQALPVVARDPRAEALRSLAELRAERLPEAGRLAEHAFRLGRVLRDYLEAVVPVTRPGDTTPELVAHLAHAGAEPAELRRLSDLLRVWDRVKFARERLTVDEAHRGEDAVEREILRERPLESAGASGAVA